MSIVRELKTCPVCHKKYSWNPDVGKMKCPNCLGIAKPKKDIMDTIFSKKKKEKTDN